MSYYSRNVVILAKLESTPGQYAAPQNTDAVLIGSNWSVSHDVQKVERDVLRAFIGGKETVPGGASAQVTFTTELAGSGTAITEPAWAALLKAAGFSGTITSGVKWDYTPISDAFPSLSLDCYYGGVKLKLKGARVSKVDFDLSVTGIPRATWTIIGIETDLNPLSEASLPAANFGSWKRPIVITDSNSADIKFGSAYTMGSGNLTGGTAYPSTGLKLSVTNNAKFRPFLGGDSVPITQREVTGEIVLDPTAANRVALYEAFKTNAVQSMSFAIGTASGAILKLFMPSVEINDPSNQDDDGLLLAGYSIRARPVNGNDELRLVTM